jgi:hypothetical protein
MSASVTVSMPSATLNALCSSGFAPAKASSAARRAAARVSGSPTQAALGLGGAPRPRGHATQRDARIGHAVALQVHGHRRRGQREGIRLAVADLVVRRGPAHGPARDADAHDEFVGRQHRFQVWRGAGARCNSRTAPCARRAGSACRPPHRRRPAPSRCRRDTWRCRPRWCRARRVPGNAADRRTAAAGFPLVAGREIRRVAEIGAARALHQIAADGRHVADLLRKRPATALPRRRGSGS